MSCQRPDHPTYSTLSPPHVGYPEEDTSRAVPPGLPGYDAESENDPPPPYSPPRPSTTPGVHAAPIVSTVPGSLAGLNERLANWIGGISYDAFVQGVNEALRSARTTRPRHTIAQTTTGWRVTAAWAAGDYIGDRIELELLHFPPGTIRPTFWVSCIFSHDSAVSSGYPASVLRRALVHAVRVSHTVVLQDRRGRYSVHWNGHSVAL